MKMTTWNELGGKKRGQHLKLVERRIDLTLIQESNDRGISRGYKGKYGDIMGEGGPLYLQKEQREVRVVRPLPGTKVCVG